MRTTFTSRFHPTRSPDLWAFRTALLRPLATCLLMLSIALLVQVLQHQPLGLWLWLGLPLALLIAMGWTAYWMQQTLAEVHLQGDLLVLRTIWDVLTGRHPLPCRLLGVRRDHDRTHLFCPDALYTLRDADWPEMDRLLDALRSSDRDHTASTSASAHPIDSTSPAS